jgi:hypothetical protein
MHQIKILLSFFLSFQLLFIQVRAQDQKEVDFKKACSELLQSISKKQLVGLNSYLNPTYGVYVLFRTGAMDEYKDLKKLNGNIPFRFEEHPVTEADLKKYPLQYGNLPSYDCDRSAWSKRTFIADSVKKYKSVTNIVAFRIKYEYEKLSRKNMDTIKFVEQNSRKIIFTSNKGDGIIFYMACIKGKWWLSVIDTVTTDCSA